MKIFRLLLKLKVCKNLVVIKVWHYKEISREKFEQVKDQVETFIKEFGGKVMDIQLPYEQSTETHFDNVAIKHISSRPVFEFNNMYFRVDEICFKDKPFVVIEVGNYEEVLNNTMEDTDPFPYDLSDEDIKKEVSYSLRVNGLLKSRMP